MSKDIYVSVIIPVYNTANYIEKCLLSVINQSLKNIEIICINDGSTDDSLLILKKYANIDNRIKIIDKANSGAGDSRNKGLEIAKGRYIAFLDSDDWIDDNFLEDLYNEAINNDLDLIKGGCIYEEKNKQTKGILNQRIYEAQKRGLDIVSEFRYEWWSALYRHDIIKEKKIRFENTRLGEDTLFLITFICSTHSFSILDEVFYHYEQRENSIVHSIKKDDLRDLLYISKKILEILNLREVDNKSKAIYILNRTEYLITYYNLAMSSLYKEEYINLIMNFISIVKSVIPNVSPICMISSPKELKRYYKQKNKQNTFFSINRYKNRIECYILGIKIKIRRNKILFTLQKNHDCISYKIEENKKIVLSEINKIKRDIDTLKYKYDLQNKQYQSEYHTNWAHTTGMCDMVQSNNFEERFKRLIKNLEAADVATLVRIIRRLQLIKGTTEKIDIYSLEEKELLQKLKIFKQEILKISDNLFCYKHYFLPINHFEESVFFYNHGLEKIKNIFCIKDKAIIDVGAFIGDSALIFSPLTNDKVYCFEATTENYNNMLKTIELNNLKNIIPIKTALGSTSSEIEIRFGGSCSSVDEVMVKSPQYIEKCKVIPLDDWVRENKVDIGLIKVDIEGAEQDFLKGAVNTIKKQRPILLISIYHNVDDFLDIKPMIESWNLNYKFKIFKPTNNSVSSETLLICEPNDN